MDSEWRHLGGELVFDAGIFRLRRERFEHGSRETHPYYVLESPPWVNVVAVTPDDQVVLVRQFRQGVREVSLEVPGGVVDPADPDPDAAAMRELREETGSGGVPLHPLCAVTSNPAVLDNCTHTFVARGVRRLGEPEPDENEDLEVVLHPVAGIRELLLGGEIQHSLSVVALAMFLHT